MSTPTIAKPCPHTAKLANLIATEAAGVVNLLSELIGNGNEEAATLWCMRLAVARMGYLADTLTRAHGSADTIEKCAEAWLMPGSGELDALKALTSRATAKGGAA